MLGATDGQVVAARRRRSALLTGAKRRRRQQFKRKRRRSWSSTKMDCRQLESCELMSKISEHSPSKLSSPLSSANRHSSRKPHGWQESEDLTGNPSNNKQLMNEPAKRKSELMWPPDPRSNLRRSRRNLLFISIACSFALVMLMVSDGIGERTDSSTRLVATQHRKLRQVVAVSKYQAPMMTRLVRRDTKPVQGNASATASNATARGEKQKKEKDLNYERLMKLKQKYETNRAISDIAYHSLLVAYSLFIILGTTFNSLICFTVILKPSILSPRNIFIVNLAASDLLLCVFTMPFSFIQISMKMWRMGSLTCKLVAGLQATSIFVSTISITAIALDRYKVIVYPVQQETHRGTRGAGLLLACVWLGALLLSFPLFYFRSVLHFTLNLPQDARSVELCVESWPLTHGRGIYSVISMIFQYVLPITIVSVVYAKISDKLQKRLIRRQRLTQLEWQQKRQLTLIRRTHTMLISVSLIFGLSWLPLNLLNVIGDFSDLFMEHDEQLFKIIFAVCHLIGCSSACTNPILYGYLNDNFRKELQQVYTQHARRLARLLAPLCLCCPSLVFCGGRAGGKGRAHTAAAPYKVSNNQLGAGNSSSSLERQPPAPSLVFGGKPEAPIKQVSVAQHKSNNHYHRRSPEDEATKRSSPPYRVPLLALADTCKSPAEQQPATATCCVLEMDGKRPRPPPLVNLPESTVASDGDESGAYGSIRRCSTMTTASSSGRQPFGATMRFCLCISGSSSIETIGQQHQPPATSGTSNSSSCTSPARYNFDESSLSAHRSTSGGKSLMKMHQLSVVGQVRARKWRRTSRRPRSQQHQQQAQSPNLSTADDSHCECRCHRREQSVTRAASCEPAIVDKSKRPAADADGSIASDKHALEGEAATKKTEGSNSPGKHQGRRVWLRFLPGGARRAADDCGPSPSTPPPLPFRLCGRCTQAGCVDRRVSSDRKCAASGPAAAITTTTSTTVGHPESEDISASAAAQKQRPMLVVAPSERHLQQQQQQKQTAATNTYYLGASEESTGERVGSSRERSASLLVLEADESSTLATSARGNDETLALETRSAATSSSEQSVSQRPSARKQCSVLTGKEDGGNDQQQEVLTNCKLANGQRPVAMMRMATMTTTGLTSKDAGCRGKRRRRSSLGSSSAEPIGGDDQCRRDDDKLITAEMPTHHSSDDANRSAVASPPTNLRHSTGSRSFCGGGGGTNNEDGDETSTYSCLNSRASTGSTTSTSCSCSSSGAGAGPDDHDDGTSVTSSSSRHQPSLTCRAYRKKHIDSKRAAPLGSHLAVVVAAAAEDDGDSDEKLECRCSARAAGGCAACHTSSISATNSDLVLASLPSGSFGGSTASLNETQARITSAEREAQVKLVGGGVGLLEYDDNGDKDRTHREALGVMVNNKREQEHRADARCNGIGC